MISRQGAIIIEECRKAVSAFYKSSLDRLTPQDNLQCSMQRIVQYLLQSSVQMLMQSSVQILEQKSMQNDLQKNGSDVEAFAERMQKAR